MAVFANAKSNSKAFFNSRALILIVGLASFWAYFDSCFFSLNIIGGIAGDSSGMIPVLQGIGLTTSAAISFAAMRFPSFFGRALSKRSTFMTASAVACVAVLPTSLPVVSHSSIPLCISLCIGGASSGILMFEWIRLFSVEDRDENRRSAGLLVTGSMATAGILVLAMSVAKTQFCTPAVASMPILGVVMRILYDKQGSPVIDSKLTDGKLWAPFSTDAFVSRFGITKRLLFSIVVFSVVTAMAQHLMIESDISGLKGIQEAYEISRYGTALVVLIGALSLTWKPYMVFRAGMLFVIGAYMVSPFLPNEWRFVSVIVTNGGYTCLELMVWTVLFESSRLRSANAIKVVGTGRFIIMASSLVGLVASTSFKSILFQPDIASAFPIFVAYVLMIAVVVVLDESKSVSAWYLIESSLSFPGTHMDSLQQRCRIIASNHRLSPRETDVLTLLAAGRSASYISQELSIANSTVNYHIRHIYEKCGVSSKQELIDLVGDASSH